MNLSDVLDSTSNLKITSSKMCKLVEVNEKLEKIKKGNFIAYYV